MAKTPPAPSAAAQKTWPWLFPFEKGHISQFWSPPAEYGIDISLPQGTPITSLTTGRVLGVGYPKCPGGVCSVESIISGQLKSVYYQHLDSVVVKPGDQVKIGQLIGYSGGQLQGGDHPAERMCSSGPHIEIGINAPWGGVWHALGENENPLQWLQGLISSAFTPSAPGKTWSGAKAVGRAWGSGNAPGFLGLEESVSAYEQLIGIPYEPPPPELTDPLGPFVYTLGWVGSFFATNAVTLLLRTLFVIAGAVLILGALNAAWETIVSSQAGQQLAEKQRAQQEGATEAAGVVAPGESSAAGGSAAGEGAAA